MNSTYNFYRRIHKAIRSMIFDLVAEAGRVDFSRNDEVARLRESSRRAFAFLSLHADLENTFIAPLFERCDPSLGDLIGGAHEEQETELHEMLAALDRIDGASPDAPVEGHAFVLRLSRFAGDSLIHMADEEEVVMPALRRAYSDVTLMEVDRRLVASVPQEAAPAAFRWMIPALNASERAELLAEIRVNAPAPVFERIRQIAREALSADADAELERALQPVAAA